MTRVLVVYTGGTIGMRPDAVDGGLVPALSGEELIDLDPTLGEIADLEVLAWGAKPSTALSFEDVLDIARTVRRGAERPDVDGLVVVQGTDLLEETAYALDLLLRLAKPLVLVGAMRAAEEPGSDAQVNLRDAIRVAATPAAAAAGALVVSAGRIHAAADVVKAHSTAIDAFASPNEGPLGRVSAAGVELARRPPGARIPMPAAAAPVWLITVGLGVDGREVTAALAGGAAGLVLAAGGSGQTHPGVLESCAEALARDVPVALATRCHAGGVHTTYGYPGGGARWARAGAILAGTLSPAKCRVALALGIGAGLDRQALAEVLGRPAVNPPR